MKLFLCLALVGLALAKPIADGQGCIYIEGRCSEACPVGTHEYAVGCDYITPEATCANPTPAQDTLGMICDYSSCYCDAPTVRDERTGQCVTLDKCKNKSKSEPTVTLRDPVGSKYL